MRIKAGRRSGGTPAEFAEEAAAANAATSGAPAVIHVENLEAGYESSPVVREVSFQVPSGHWLGLIGANGAGKSTLLRAVAGLLPYQGTVRIHGARPAGGERARLVAYLPQRPLLPPGMTVAEYVLLGRSAHLSWLAVEGKRDYAAAAAAMERLDIAGFADRDVTALSGGEVQRVCLARALAQEADLLLLDEPTSALDIGHQVGVLELVDELRRERDLTVVAAMHDLTSAGRFADQLLLLAGGTTLAIGAPEDVLTEPLLGRAYDAAVTLMRAPDGSLVVVPTRSSFSAESHSPSLSVLSVPTQAPVPTTATSPVHTATATDQPESA